METEIVKIDSKNPEPEYITKAVGLITAGEIIGFPTETVYGLGANALDEQAVAKIFSAKRRPANNPIIVHIANIEDVKNYATNVSQTAWTLMEQFWPGPLSLVLKKKRVIPDITTAGLDTVVLRLPSHPVARKLIEECSVPIAAPSANYSGLPSSTRAEHVIDDLAGLIPLILDGGPVEHGLESTVIDCTEEKPVILRPGSITEEMICGVTNFSVNTKPTDKARSPGLLHRHYAPKHPMTLAQSKESLYEYLAKKNDMEKIAVVHHSELEVALGDHFRKLPSEPTLVAPLLFDTLRKIDKSDIEEIVVEGYKENGIGKSLMERLRRGASLVV